MHTMHAHYACIPCMHTMHACMHICRPAVHAYYACTLCMHTMHACILCMHAPYACILCMHAYYACMHIMHALADSQTPGCPYEGGDLAVEQPGRHGRSGRDVRW